MRFVDYNRLYALAGQRVMDKRGMSVIFFDAYYMLGYIQPLPPIFGETVIGGTFVDGACGLFRVRRAHFHVFFAEES